MNENIPLRIYLIPIAIGTVSLMSFIFKNIIVFEYLSPEVSGFRFAQH